MDPELAKQTIAKAIEVIGQQAEDDYILVPKAHAEKYTGTAPELVALLQDSVVERLAKDYSAYDTAAIAAQKTFKKKTETVNRLVLASAILTAVMMSGGLVASTVTPPDPRGNYIVAALGIVAAGLGAWAAVILAQLRLGRLLEAWMRERANAETTRLEYFAEVSSLVQPESSPTLRSLALEYFRRYQVDVQLSYYQTRSRAHTTSANSTLLLASIAVGLSTLTTALSGLMNATQGPIWSILGVFGVAGVALGSYATSREAMNQDQRNSERYERTRVALAKVQDRLRAVRPAVLAGNLEALNEFVKAANDQISLEHRQWLEDGKGANEAVKRLDEAIAKLKGPAAPAQQEKKD